MPHTYSPVRRCPRCSSTAIVAHLQARVWRLRCFVCDRRQTWV